MRAHAWARLLLAAGPPLAPAPDGEAADAAAPPVTALAVAPGGEELLCGSQAGLAARPWPDSEGIERRFATELLHVHDVAFAPDGASFAAVGGEPGFEGVLERRSWPDGALLERRALTDDLLYAVAWRPDGGALVCTGHGGEVLWLEPSGGEASADRPPRRFEGHLSPVLDVAFLPDGARFVTAGTDRSLRVWDAASGEAERVLSNHTGAVRGVAARPGPGSAGAGLPLVASIGDDRTVRFWQPTLGRLVRFARLPAEPLDLAWSGGERVLVAARDGRLYSVDAVAVTDVRGAPACDGWAYSLAVAAGGPPPGPTASDASRSNGAGRSLRAAVGGAEGDVRAVPLPLAGGEGSDAPSSAGGAPRDPRESPVSSPPTDP